MPECVRVSASPFGGYHRCSMRSIPTHYAFTEQVSVAPTYELRVACALIVRSNVYTLSELCDAQEVR